MFFNHERVIDPGEEGPRRRVQGPRGRLIGVAPAAAIITLHQGRAAYWPGAPRPDASKLPLTTHLIWHGIKLAIQRGCREFELVGANTPRFNTFKAKRGMTPSGRTRSCPSFAARAKLFA